MGSRSSLRWHDSGGGARGSAHCTSGFSLGQETGQPMVTRLQGFLGDQKSLHHNSHHHNRPRTELLKKGASSLEFSRLEFSRLAESITTFPQRGITGNQGRTRICSVSDSDKKKINRERGKEFCCFSWGRAAI